MSLEGAADAPTEAVEASLVDRLLRLQTAAAPLPAEKQQWYADAYAFLQAHGGQHWWCRHSDVTAGNSAGPAAIRSRADVRSPQRNSALRLARARACWPLCWLHGVDAPTICRPCLVASAGLAELLRYHEQQPLVQAIWGQLAAQLAACTDCANAHHAFQEALADQYAEETAAPLAVAMHELDCVRLAAALADTAAAAAADEVRCAACAVLPQISATLVRASPSTLEYYFSLLSKLFINDCVCTACAGRRRRPARAPSPGYRLALRGPLLRHAAGGWGGVCGGVLLGVCVSLYV
jgi:hypothetical protein